MTGVVETDASSPEEEDEDKDLLWRLREQQRDQEVKLVELKASSAELRRDLAERETQEAADVAEAARDALTVQRRTSEAAFQRIRSDIATTHRSLEYELEARRTEKQKEDDVHNRTMANLREKHDTEVQGLQAAHLETMRREREQRKAETTAELTSFRDARSKEIDDIDAATQQARSRVQSAEARVAALRQAVKETESEAKQRRKDIEGTHRREMQRLQEVVQKTERVRQDEEHHRERSHATKAAMANFEHRSQNVDAMRSKESRRLLDPIQKSISGLHRAIIDADKRRDKTIHDRDETGTPPRRLSRTRRPVNVLSARDDGRKLLLVTTRVPPLTMMSLMLMRPRR